MSEILQEFLSLKRDRTFGTRLLEFWSTVFIGAGPKVSEFGSRIASQFSHAKITNEEISFTPAILNRKSKQFLVVTKGVVRAVISLSRIGQDGVDLYVSARYLFQASFNRWKQIALHLTLIQIALIQSIFFFWPVWLLIGPTKEVLESEHTYINGVTSFGSTGRYIDVPNWNNALLAYVITFLSLYGVWWLSALLINYWRYNDPFAMTRNDFDELDRDDLAALAYEVSIVVHTIADEMTLAQMEFEEKPKREFGFMANSNIKRQPRI